jgi:hypothetical protein
VFDLTKFIKIIMLIKSIKSIRGMGATTRVAPTEWFVGATLVVALT